jgi:hypothetical protein
MADVGSLIPESINEGTSVTTPMQLKIRQSQAFGA